MTPAYRTHVLRGPYSVGMEPLHEDGIGAPDGLERLWTPYRMAYIRGESKPVDDSAGECPFCRIPQEGTTNGSWWYAAARRRTPC